MGCFYEKITKMKRTTLIIFILAAAINAGLAQNVDDALRYSQIFYNGTARFNSMGGAFTALGGDISSLGQNPAGIGIFRTSEISLTPQLYNFKSMTNFNGSNNKDYLYDFNLGHGGIILNLRNKNTTTGLVTLNIGYSFNRTNNLNQTIKIEGTSEKSSLLDFWAEAIEGVHCDSMFTFVHYGLSKRYIEDHPYIPDAAPAWNTWLIDTLPGIVDSYGTAYNNYGRYSSNYGKEMTRVISNTGYTGEHSIALGGNYSNRLFFGLALAITRLEYESKFGHSEVSDSVLVSGFNNFSYDYYYRNWGTGYSLKFGLIYKPIEFLRVGFTFHSPTLFKINEYLSDNIVSKVEGKVEDHFENTASWFTYNLMTPFRFTLGAAYQLKKLAILSAEYEFTDYGMASFSTIQGDDFDYSEKNKAIKSSLKTVSNFRSGAEIRLNRLYFRAGYGFYGKAYHKGDLNENVHYNSFSCGVGFREQNLFVDIGFTNLRNSQKYVLYSSALESPVSNLDINKNIFTVSFGYKFSY